MKKIFILYSSARPNGNTFKLVDTFRQLTSSEVCYLDDLEVGQYDYLHRNQGDDFVALIDRMLNADVLILASPVYWYSLTPAMRCFFDRLTDLTELPNLKSKGKQLTTKTFYLFATSVHKKPPASFVSPVKKSLEYLGCRFAGTIHADCSIEFNRSSVEGSLQRLVDEIEQDTDICPKMTG